MLLLLLLRCLRRDERRRGVVDEEEVVVQQIGFEVSSIRLLLLPCLFVVRYLEVIARDLGSPTICICRNEDTGVHK